MMESALDDVLLELHKIGGVKFGQYKLKSGLISPIYIDIRCIIGYPQLMIRLSDLIWERINKEKFDLVTGVPYTALPIATIISTTKNYPMVIVRKEIKAYGTGQEVEGIYSSGQKCLIIEDIATSGSSIIETHERLAKVGLNSPSAFVFIDRNQGAQENLKNYGMKLHSITTLPYLISILYKHGKIDGNMRDQVLKFLETFSQEKIITKWQNNNTLKNQLVPKGPIPSWNERALLTKSQFNKHLFNLIETKKTNLCLSADVTSKSELLSIAEKLGPVICALKTHMDIIEDFDQDLIVRLSKIAEDQNFVLFEDRKFADIGNTSQLQYTKGIHQISNWAHLTTAHIIAGKSSVDPLVQVQLELRSKNPELLRGIVLIAQMSTEDSLTRTNSESYAKKALEIANEYSHSIAGFVCQERISNDSGFLYFTPGVNIEKTCDEKGQSYNSPENVVIDRMADVIIVGRGIIKSADPLKTAEIYRERAWNAYLSRLDK